MEGIIMSEQSVFIDKRGAIAHLVLNRPDKRNALTWAMWRQLGACVDELKGDADIKVVVVRGADATAFAAGADIDELGALHTDAEAGRAYFDTMLASGRKLLSLTKPTIAQIQGPCMGAGCAIALYCDVRVADRTAKFAVPPARLGLAYSLFDTKRLVDAVGPSTARHMLYTSAALTAGEALAAGLADQVHDAETIDEAVILYAEKICSASRYSTRAAKRIIGMILDGTTEETEETRRLFLDAFQGEDFREGRAAFLEKRKPAFTFRD